MVCLMGGFMGVGILAFESLSYLSWLKLQPPDPRPTQQGPNEPFPIAYATISSFGQYLQIFSSIKLDLAPPYLGEESGWELVSNQRWAVINLQVGGRIMMPMMPRVYVR